MRLRSEPAVGATKLVSILTTLTSPPNRGCSRLFASHTQHSAMGDQNGHNVFQPDEQSGKKSHYLGKSAAHVGTMRKSRK